jgi:7-carboxy-7-deazaguanine synthase
MSILRVIEVYVSYQGEGPNTGKPTVFVRFAGCNFKCPLWPCDTQHAIDPKLFKDTQQFVQPSELADVVSSFRVNNICLTGGEVFLQNADALKEFVSYLHNAGHNIECFTNGALEWRDDIAEMINTFILDWKLDGSGESTSYDDNEAFQNNRSWLSSDDAIKFTIADRNDYEQAKYRAVKTIWPLQAEQRPKVYAGVVWGKLETEQLCEWMIEDKVDWYLNVQVHKFVWHPDKIGV